MTEPAHGMIAPGSTIGMLGGGQLGRMAALAAARLGYRTHVFAPDADCPAAQVSAAHSRADFTDIEALDRFASTVDVVTLEWENVPLDTLRHLGRRVPVRPGPEVLAVTQDRAAEKAFANLHGLPTAPWARVESAAALAAAVGALGRPGIVKTLRLGYDGRGQARLAPGEDAAAAWAAIGSPDAAILEGVIDFACEISVVLARAADGAIVAYPPVENRHQSGILHETHAPARIDPSLAEAASDAARLLADALGLVGVLAVEFFVTRDGVLLVNELAPRPHNSGHWTIDACATSQFEQQIRAVCGLPLGDPTHFANAVMTNLLGDAVERWPTLLAEPGARLHLYGKGEARPGRKMGHVTRLVSTV